MAIQEFPDDQPQDMPLTKKAMAIAKLAMRSGNPIAGMAVDATNLDAAKKRYAAGLEGLRQNDYSGNNADEWAFNKAGKYLPIMAATAMFPPAAVEGPVAAAAAPYLGRLAAPAIGTAARIAAAGAEGGLASLGASTLAGAPNVPESINRAKEFATGEGISKGLEVAVPPIWNATKWAGNKFLEKTTGLYSGTPESAWNNLRASTGSLRDKIVAYARKGMTEDALGNSIPVAKQAEQGFMRSAQDRIANAAKGAGEEYGQMIDYLHRDVPASEKFDVAGKVYDKMKPYLKTNAETLKVRTPNSPEALFGEYYDRIKHSLSEGMSPSEAADILQGLTKVQTENGKSVISAHAAELKNALIDSLPGKWTNPTIDTPTPDGISISDTRNKLRGAMKIVRGNRKFTSSSNPISTYKSLIAAGGKPAEELIKAGSETGVPGLASDLAEAKAARTGAAFAPKIGSLARTGLSSGAINALTSLVAAPFGEAGHAMAASSALQVPGIIIGSSPRLAMNAYLAGSKASGALEGIAPAVGSKLPLMLKAMMAGTKSKKKIQEFPIEEFPDQ